MGVDVLTLRERARFAYLDRQTETRESLVDHAETLLREILGYEDMPEFEPKLVTYSGADAMEFELEGVRLRIRYVGKEPWLELLQHTGSVRLQSLADLGDKLRGHPLRWEGDDA